MNISIRKQLVIIFIGLTAMLFLTNYLVNNFFLEGFYSVRKQEVLVQAYEKLNDNVTIWGSLSDDKIEEIEELCNANNISFIVTSQDYSLLFWITSDNADSKYARLMRARLFGYGTGLDGADDDSILAQNDKYTIQRRYDQSVATDYLEMWGTLDKGFYFIMRINMENIRESVRISNEFIAYICLIGMISAGIFIWFVTKWLTKPLNELTELSKRMADLDFDAKYTSGGKNEVGQLGAHFNQMSENLERTYSQLMAANNELKRDIEKKEQIDGMRKEFLSNVSHELKTPIALIQGYAEGLQECVNDDAESRAFYCEVIMDEAAKMNTLVQKLLTLNQLEFGNDQVSMERFDLITLIKNKVQSVEILAQQKGAAITYEGPNSQSVWGDEFKVEEVLTNYLSNALNHVDGEKKITVRAECLKGNVRVTVFNTGLQIPQEDLGLIWDKFYKVDKARTREYGGSGVGLSIVKAIMESFHQQYGVYNCEDGVAFWFELKQGNMAAEADKVRALPERITDPGQIEDREESGENE